MRGQRDPLSLTGRVEAFFAANPDEWLTIDDMRAKFGATPRQITTAIDHLRDQGRIDIRAVTVYRAEPAE